MKDMRKTFAMLAAILLLASAGVRAQVPQLINYQGQITDASGNPANGSFTIVFSIYAAASGGTALYSETQSVTVSNGVFNVLIGSVNPVPLNLFDSSTDRYLEITVNSTVLTPRRRFGSVPYAFTSRGAGDITAVNAGAGLAGGGNVGDIALSVANNSINSAMIQDNTILDVDVNTNAAIAGTKINPTFGAQNIVTTGNVGIGTSNPQASLHVSGTGNRFIDIASTDALASVTRLMAVTSNGIAESQLQFKNRLGFAAPISGSFKMTLLENGNVGIGITNPSAALHILKTGAPPTGLPSGENGLLLGTQSTTGYKWLQSYGGALALNPTGNNVGIRTTAPGKLLVVGNGSGSSGIINDGIFVNLLSGAAVTVRSSGPGVEVQLNAEGNIGTIGTVSFHPLNFRTNNVERMRIGTDGRVGIGTIAPTEELHVVGDICATGNIGACSSRRWKTNIEPIAGALDKVQRLRGVYYDWKADGKHDIGMIAEEVGEVIPEVIMYEENGKDANALDYARLVALLIEAVKEQQKEIAALKVEVEALAAVQQDENSARTGE